MERKAVHRVLRVAEGLPPESEQPVDKQKAVKNTEDNLYVVTYVTNSFTMLGTNTKITKLNYGPEMASSNYTRRQLEDIGIENHGDNFQWKALYWKFSIDGKPGYYKANLTKTGGLGVEDPIQLSGKPEDRIRVLDEDRLLQVGDMHGYASYPFDKSGRMKVLQGGSALPGQSYFMDISNQDGKDIPGMMSLENLKADASIGDMKSKLKGREFIENDETHNNFRIWDDRSGALVDLTGKPDPESTKVVKSILSKASEQMNVEQSPKQQGTSEETTGLFKPIHETNKELGRRDNIGAPPDSDHNPGKVMEQQRQATDVEEKEALTNGTKAENEKAYNSEVEKGNKLLQQRIDIVKKASPQTTRAVLQRYLNQTKS